eukprot:637281-Prorocentrum_lima.AAC.1
MTSSLVGSEMCIRDRPKAGKSRECLLTCVFCTVTCMARGEAVRDTMGPVSYTHLTLPTICSV